MQKIFQEIESAKKVEIVATSKYLFVASALYTYVLTCHKKVSLVCEEQDIEYKFSCMPWFDKIKMRPSPSAGITIVIEHSAYDLYIYLKRESIKINKKIATALYGALLYETKGLLQADGMDLAFGSELIELGADYLLCRKYLVEHVTLGRLRLKSQMLEKMLLVNNAQVALFFIDKEMLQATRTEMSDALTIMQEAFGLPYVESVILLHSDRENEVVKILNKENLDE